MSDAANASTPTTQPSRVGRLLDLVRKLIDYGKELAAALRQPDPDIDLAPVMRSFGTRDIALILSRIMRGLQRAEALEARLQQNGARLDKPPRRRGAPATAKPAAECQADTRLTDLPTAEQIAAEVRRRPIGAVLADICRDLGIMPCHPLWRELSRLIIRHCGSLARLVKDILDRTLSLAIRDDTSVASLSLQPSPVGPGPP